MLGNGARFLGPSAAGNAAGSTNNNQQHQAQFGRGVWPTATTFQANGGECEYIGRRRCLLLNIIVPAPLGAGAGRQAKCLLISSMLPKWKNSISLLSTMLEVEMQTKLFFLRCLRKFQHNNSWTAKCCTRCWFTVFFSRFCTFRQKHKRIHFVRCNEQRLTAELDSRAHNKWKCFNSLITKAAASERR